jgi:uncharacterized phage infection (PIP) family protein YhgE
MLIASFRLAVYLIIPPVFLCLDTPVEENQENINTTMAAPLDLDTLPNSSKLSLDEQILAAEREFLAKQPKVGIASTPAESVPAQKLNEELADAAEPALEPAVPAAEPVAEPMPAKAPAAAEITPDSPIEVIHHKRNLSLDEKIELFEKEIEQKAASKPASPEKAAAPSEESPQGKKVLSLDERLAAAEKELGAASAPVAEVKEDTRPVAERVADKVSQSANRIRLGLYLKGISPLYMFEPCLIV